MIYSGNNPVDERKQNEEVDCCAICENTLYINDPSVNWHFVDGLGRVCIGCYLIEVEIASASA